MPSTSRPDEKLPRRRILRERPIFERVRKEGTRLTGQWLSLNWKRQDGSCRRMAIIAPRLIGNAVERNAIKRRTRECYRKIQSHLPEDLISIWIARRRSGLTPIQEISKEMTKLYQRAGLIESHT